MCQLIETIKIVEGQFQNIACHNNRLNRSRKDFFKLNDEIDIAKSVDIPDSARQGIYKCTVTYNEKITEIKFQPYSIREIKSLKIVTDNTILYNYKYADRSALNNLLERKGRCDEIIIVKNDRITDTSFSNIILYDGKNWLTPDTPLLKGIQREKFLKDGLIQEAEIRTKDLTKFQSVGLINAMLEIGDITIDVSNIENE
jgi:4-amino-4-deoxychorismate lyase